MDMEIFEFMRDNKIAIEEAILKTMNMEKDEIKSVETYRRKILALRTEMGNMIIGGIILRERVNMGNLIYL
jgi:hypothetical protein